MLYSYPFTFESPFFDVLSDVFSNMDSAGTMEQIRNSYKVRKNAVCSSLKVFDMKGDFLKKYCFKDIFCRLLWDFRKLLRRSSF